MAPSGAQLGFPTVCRAEQILSVERSFWIFELLYNFLKGKQLLLKDIFRRTSCCSLGSWRGHAGGIFAGTTWELPAGSCYSELAEFIPWPRNFCSTAQASVSIQVVLCGWLTLNMQQSLSQNQCIPFLSSFLPRTSQVIDYIKKIWPAQPSRADMACSRSLTPQTECFLQGFQVRFPSSWGIHWDHWVQLLALPRTPKESRHVP